MALMPAGEDVEGMNKSTQRVRVRLTALLALLAGLLLFGTESACGAVTVQVESDRVSVQAEAASLAEILQAVGAAGHFALRLDTPLPDPVSLQIEHQPLREVLEALLRDQNTVFRYARDGTAARLEEVWVLVGASPASRTGEAAGPSDLRPSEEQMLVQVATSPDGKPAERIGAAIALADTDAAGRGDAILGDLLRTSDDPQVRQETLAALAALPTVPLETLAAAALHDPAPAVRELALALVSALAPDDPRAQEVLQQAALLESEASLQQLAQELAEASQAASP